MVWLAERLWRRTFSTAQDLIDEANRSIKEAFNTDVDIQKENTKPVRAASAFLR
jgi:hypothetical protein